MRVIRAMQWLFLGLSAGAAGIVFVGCAETVKPPAAASASASAPAAPASGSPAPASQAAPAVDVASTPVPAIPPGTIIADREPKDFSHLILKSQPRVGADSVEKVSSSLANMASMLFTAIAADCRREKHDTETSYTLANVAAGVGMKVKGEDMVLSSESAGKLGVNLGLVDSTVLGGGEKQLQQMRCVARSSTLAILDAPSIMLVDGKHKAVTIRYAILVDPKTGQLDALAWPMKKAGDKLEVIGAAEWLPANKVDDCQLHVDTGEFILGMPTANAFAVRGAPKGKESLELSGDLKTLAATLPWTASAAVQLESALRAMMAIAARPR